MLETAGYVLAAIGGAVVTIFAVRAKFDINRYLEDRRSRKQQEECLHIEFWTENPGDGRMSFAYQVLLESPAGTRAMVESG